MAKVRIDIDYSKQKIVSSVNGMKPDPLDGNVNIDATHTAVDDTTIKINNDNEMTVNIDNDTLIYDQQAAAIKTAYRAPEIDNSTIKMNTSNKLSVPIDDTTIKVVDNQLKAIIPAVPATDNKTIKITTNTLYVPIDTTTVKYNETTGKVGVPIDNKSIVYDSSSQTIKTVAAPSGQYTFVNISELYTFLNSIQETQTSYLILTLNFPVPTGTQINLDAYAGYIEFNLTQGFSTTDADLIVALNAGGFCGINLPNVGSAIGNFMLMGGDFYMRGNGAFKSAAVSYGTLNIDRTLTLVYASASIPCFSVGYGASMHIDTLLGGSPTSVQPFFNVLRGSRLTSRRVWDLSDPYYYVCEYGSFIMNGNITLTPNQQTVVGGIDGKEDNFKHRL
jgi:hypothetical protein